MRLIRNLLLTIFGAVIVVLLALTTWFRVAEHEEALVLTMGRATRQVEKGVHGKLPWPIETVITRPVRLTHQLTFGYDETKGLTTLVPEEALMITGDENLVWADLLVEWKVADIKKFEFASDNPERVLRNAVAASLRSVIGTKKLDYAITSGKGQIQAEVQEHLIALMQGYDVGVSVESVKLQDVEPPDEVKTEFKAVNDARESKQTKINEAEKYRNERIPTARGEAQQRVQKALGDKTTRINQALGDVANFKAIYEAYQKNPEITEKRLLLETLEQILPGADIVIIDSSDGGTVKYLPIKGVQ